MNVHGLNFQLPVRFKEGHTCSAAEAAALQQTFQENIRNNKAKAVKKVIDEAGGPDKVTPQQLEALQKEITEYASSYEFYPVNRVSVDPVTSLARKTAKELITNQLKRDPNRKLREITPEEWAKMIDKALEKNPKIIEFAREQVTKQRKLAI